MCLLPTSTWHNSPAELPGRGACPHSDHASRHQLRLQPAILQDWFLGCAGSCSMIPAQSCSCRLQCLVLLLDPLSAQRSLLLELGQILVESLATRQVIVKVV